MSPRVAVRGAYEAPRLRKLGKVESWAKGSLQGTFTDAAFPVHTPIGNITFTTT